MVTELAERPADTVLELAAGAGDMGFEAAAIAGALGRLTHGLVLFGHLHLRVHCRLRTASGELDVIGASGAALDHSDSSVRTGFTPDEIAGDGSLASI